MPEIVLQPGESAAIDTYIDENSPTGNYGTADTIRLGIRSDSDNYDGLLKFDLSSIAPGSKVQEAKLTLTAYANIGSGTRGLRITRILPGNSDWTEGGCTWNTKDGSNSWAGSAGCETVGTDIANSDLFADSSYTWVTVGDNEFDLNVSEFQALIDVGNYGIKVASYYRTSTVDRVVYVRSSTYATAGDRPELYVRWIAPSGKMYEYTFNKYDPKKEVFDGFGRRVDPNEIRPDNWMFVYGSSLPTARAYESLVVDPRTNYIVGITNREDKKSVGIEFSRNQFADQVVKRLVRGV